MKAIVSTLPPPPQPPQPAQQPGTPSAPSVGFKGDLPPPPPSYQSRYVQRKIVLLKYPM
jgi:hypothetical protein